MSGRNYCRLSSCFNVSFFLLVYLLLNFRPNLLRALSSPPDLFKELDSPAAGQEEEQEESQEESSMRVHESPAESPDEEIQGGLGENGCGGISPRESSPDP